MDLIKVAKELKPYIINCDKLPNNHPEYGKDHLYFMLDKIITKEIDGEKAHRWIGWAQACICFGGGASLEDLKQMNKKA